MSTATTRHLLPDIEPLRGVYRPLTDSVLLTETFANAELETPSLVLDVCCGSVNMWDGLEGIEERFDIEVVSAPSGATHLTFDRK